MLYYVRRMCFIHFVDCFVVYSFRAYVQLPVWCNKFFLLTFKIVYNENVFFCTFTELLFVLFYIT